MQNDAADQLDIVMALTERALGSFAHGRESFGQKIVERLAFGETLFEFISLRFQFFSRKLLEFRFERVDAIDGRLQRFDIPIVRRAK